jgi:hypothetical protein
MVSGPQTPIPSKQRQIPVNTPRFLLAESHMMPNSQGKMQQASRTHARVGQSNDPETELRTLVLRLTTKVDRLTDMVSQLQAREAMAASKPGA